MEVKITGKLHVVCATEQVTEKFRKREFVVMEEESYRGKVTQHFYPVQMTFDNCDKLDGFNVGDNVVVSAELSGREYDKKDGSGKGYMVSVTAWDIQKTGSASTTTATAAPAHQSSAPEPKDDLPF